MHESRHYFVARSLQKYCNAPLVKREAVRERKLAYSIHSPLNVFIGKTAVPNDGGDLGVMSDSNDPRYYQ